MTRRGFRFSLAAMMIASTALVAWGQEAKKPDAASAAAAKESPTTESTHKVKADRLKIEVNLSGVFEAAQSWPVNLQPNSWSSFTVIKAVPHGKRVKKGDTLVWLDMSKIDEQLQDLEYSRELSKLSQQLAIKELELLQETTPLDRKSAERKKRIADEDLDYFNTTDRAYQTESAEFSLKSSKQSLEYAQEELDQLEQMYKADDLTEETEEIILKRARNDVERAKFYLKSAEMRYARTLEKDLPRESQQLEEAALRAEIALAKAYASLPTNVDKQKIELEKQKIADARAQAKLEELRQDREMMKVPAPADGYVYYGQFTRGKWSGVDAVSSQLKEGGKLSPHSVFMTVVNPRPLLIRVEVPEKELHRIRRNATGEAVPDGYPELKLTATCQLVSDFPISKGTFDGQFQVALDDSARPIVPGMGCKLTLVVYDKADAITVPASAVFEGDDGVRDVVYLQQEGQEPEKRKVVIGQKTDQKWEVVSGLKEGDQILLKEPKGS